MRRTASLALTGLAVLGTAACSADASDYSNEAETFIEDEGGEVSQQVGEVFADAECTRPADTERGTTFDCTAVTESGETWAFLGRVGDGNTVLVQALGPLEGTSTTTSAPASSVATTSTTSD
jgi:hypothetical protein